jgi:hypothetical protein
VEYDDRPGAIRDELVGMVRAWQDALLRCARQAIEMGHLRADTDPQQLVYEMHGLILALHHDARFIKRPGSVNRAQVGFERLIESYRSNRTEPDTASAAKPKPAVKKTA